LPGQFIIWLAAVIYGLLAGWENLGWPVFFILTLATLIASIIDLFAGWWGAKRGGASNRAIIAGFAVGLIGLIIFNALGALIGILLGIAGYEYLEDSDRDWQRALKAAGGYLVGLLVSLVVRFFIALGMVIFFVVQV
jgi:hypothetical protein